MAIKEKLKNLVEKINEHKVRTITGLGLAGLVAFTSLKDNVHFGAVRLNNPQENHYAWGVWPTIEIKEKKDVKGNFYSIGLLVGRNVVEPNSTITGDMKGYGLFAGLNDIGTNSTITGDMKAYGLLGGGNNIGDNSTITGDMRGYGLIVGVNESGDNSTITGDMKAYGLLEGGNELGDNSTITGNIISRGLVAGSPKGVGIGTNVEIGLKDYVVKKEAGKRERK